MLGMNTVIHSDILVIELEGALDSHTSSDFKSWIEEKLLEGWRAFILDCLCLEYLSSRGIGVLTETSKIIANANGKLAVIHLSAEVKNLFNFVGLDKLIDTPSSLEEGRERLRDFVKQMSAPENISPMKSSAGEKEDEPGEAVFVVPEPVLDEEIYLPQEQPTGKSAPEHKEPANQNTSSGPAMLLYEEEPNAYPEISKDLDNQEPEPEQLHTHQPASEPDTVTSARPALEPLPENFPKIQSCSNCGVDLRLPKPGTYICPACRHRFSFP